jgi:hypothetical protein
MDEPRYGTPNREYLASWFQREDPGGPMWALNLMKYRAVADYSDGRETTISGQQADDLYSPIGPLTEIGGRIVLAAPVIHQLVGDDTTWDRVAIAQYPYRTALIEMNMRPDFQELHVHKDAGMDSTIVMGTFPVEGDPIPEQASGAGADRLLLLQVVAATDTPDMAGGIDSIRIGRFWIEDAFLGDGRKFAEARYDLISRTTAEELAAVGARQDDANYVVIADPVIDEVASSLTDTTRVLL